VAVSGMTSSGSVTATIGAGGATDTAGNGNTASTSTDNSVTFNTTTDTTPPTVSINQATGQADPTTASPINFTVVFSEPVSGFTNADVAITGTAGGSKTVAVTGGPSTYTVAVSGMTTSGTVIATIAAGMAQDAAGNLNTASTSTDNTVTFATGPPPSGGDVFVAIGGGTSNGAVQWRNPDGSLRRTLTGVSDGQASSVAFDAAGNIYVPHWYRPNIVERFDANGNFLGPFGSGYNEAPSSIAFDAAGFMYVGFADPPGDILKFDAAGTLVASFDVLTTNRGTDHIALASDGCTMFYTSRDQNIYRYNVCTRTQLLQFNSQPLPGDAAYHLVILPDGGVLVADGTGGIVRLDASGNQIKTYFVIGETQIWGGVDFVGDGTFWATNAWTDNVYKFDLQSGAVLASFNTGTGGGFTAAGVGVRR
jgi:hypothetical protein